MREITLATTDQLSTPDDYRNIVIDRATGAAVKLGDVATVERGAKTATPPAGSTASQPCLIVTKQPNANVIETVDQD
jgi:multidrug efflux pump